MKVGQQDPQVRTILPGRCGLSFPKCAPKEGTNVGLAQWCCNSVGANVAQTGFLPDWDSAPVEHARRNKEENGKEDRQADERRAGMEKEERSGNRSVHQGWRQSPRVRWNSKKQRNLIL